MVIFLLIFYLIFRLFISCYNVSDKFIMYVQVKNPERFNLKMSVHVSDNLAF